MGDPKTQSQEWGQLIGKILLAAAYIAIGMIAKLAIDSRQQKLTRWQILFKVAIMFFTGFVSFVACDASGHIKWAGVITPVATMLGETLALYILNNVQSWLDWATAKFKKKDK